LRRLMAKYSYQLKFVISEPGDLQEVCLMVGDLGVDRSRVILMPEGVDAAALAVRGRWLVEICKREGFRFSPRLHVDLWGNRRGV
jgi:7-carboxy-7-deazaguanine synthase